MTGINPLFGTTVGLNANGSGATKTETEFPGTAVVPASAEAADAASHSNEDRIELSTRAQKLQELKAEFFPGGYRNIKITTAFIERLREYGFLSPEDADQLMPSGQGSPIEATADQLEALSQFVERLAGELKQKDPANKLVGILNRADAVLTGLDQSFPTAETPAIKSVIADLSRYADSEAASLLSERDRRGLHKLDIALRIADRIDRESDAASQVNRYLALLQQS